MDIHGGHGSACRGPSCSRRIKKEASLAERPDAALPFFVFGARQHTVLRRSNKIALIEYQMNRYRYSLACIHSCTGIYGAVSPCR